MNARGGFVATWVRLPALSGEPEVLLARRFAADGRPATSDIAVLDDPPTGVNNSQVALRDDGNFVVVGAVPRQIFGRRYRLR